MANNIAPAAPYSSSLPPLSANHREDFNPYNITDIQEERKQGIASRNDVMSLRPVSMITDQNQLDRHKVMIRRVEEALDALESNLLGPNNTEEVVENVRKQEILNRQLAAYKKRQYSLQLKEVARNRTFGFSPEIMEHILDICKEVGNTTAVVAAFSASISISILFGAVRGNLFFFFASWWCAIISLVTSLGLSVLGARRDQPPDQATGKDWWRVHAAGGIVVWCLLSAVGSIVSMCYGVIHFDVGPELTPDHPAPHVIGGPSLPNGVPWVTDVIASIFIFLICGGSFFALFFGPFRFAHQKTWSKRAEREEAKETNDFKRHLGIP